MEKDQITSARSLELMRCNGCQRTVLPKADGTCPSCRRANGFERLDPVAITSPPPTATLAGSCPEGSSTSPGNSRRGAVGVGKAVVAIGVLAVVLVIQGLSSAPKPKDAIVGEWVRYVGHGSQITEIIRRTFTSDGSATHEVLVPKTELLDRMTGGGWRVTARQTGTYRFVGEARIEIVLSESTSEWDVEFSRAPRSLHLSGPGRTSERFEPGTGVPTTPVPFQAR